MDVVCEAASTKMMVLAMSIHSGLANISFGPPFANSWKTQALSVLRKTNISHGLVWKDLPFSELRAPLDKEEKGRLIKE